MFKPQDKGPRMHCFSCIVWCSHRNKKEEAQVSNYHLWAEETLFLSVFTFFWGLFSSPTLFAATGQQPTWSWFLFSAEQLTFFLSFWSYGFICGWPRPVSSRSAKLPGWRSHPIVTIVTLPLGVSDTIYNINTLDFVLPSSWFSSASSVLRSLNSVLYLNPFLFPGFLSFPWFWVSLSSFLLLSPLLEPSLFFFVVCQVPAGGRSCNITKKKFKGGVSIFNESRSAIRALCQTPCIVILRR